MNRRIRNWWNWKEGQSIIKGRSKKGQVILKKKLGTDATQRHRFLIRVGKDVSREIVGTKEEAFKELDELLFRRSVGVLPEPDSRMRLDTYFEKHFLPHKKKAVMPATFAEYERIFRTNICPCLGHIPLGQLTEEAVEDWVDSLWEAGLAKKTIKNYVTLLRAGLSRAQNKGWISANPAALVQLVRSDPELFVDEGDPEQEAVGPPVDVVGGACAFERQVQEVAAEADEGAVDMSRVWSESELCDFLTHAPTGHPMTNFGIIGVRAGPRPGELCALMWKHVDLRRGLIVIAASVVKMDKVRARSRGRWVRSKIPKTGWRVVALPNDAVEALRNQAEYVNDLLRKGRIDRVAAQFVFPAVGGAKPYMNPDQARKGFHRLIEGRADRKSAHGLPVRYIPPYGLRHTHATDLLRNSWSDFAVAKRLGTSRDMVYRHYGHLLPDLQRERLNDMTQVTEQVTLNIEGRELQVL